MDRSKSNLKFTRQSSGSGGMSDKNRSHTGISLNENSLIADTIELGRMESDDDSDEFKPDVKQERRKITQEGNMGGLFGIALQEDEGDDLEAETSQINDKGSRMTSHFSFVDTNLDKFNILQFIHTQENRNPTSNNN